MVLSLMGSPRVTIGGSHPDQFTVSSQPAATVAPNGGTTTFIIRFSPVGLGFRSASVSIINDSGSSPYQFVITGTGVANTVIVESGGTDDVGKYSSIAVDSNGKGHISFYNDTDNRLMYANNTSSAWIDKTFSSTDNWGMDTSIALDSSDKVHINYYHGSSGDLEYAVYNGVSWWKRTLDSSGNGGRYSSITVHSDGSIHISYYDVTNGNLKYAWF